MIPGDHEGVEEPSTDLRQWLAYQRYTLHKSPDDIADILGVSVSAVKYHLKHLSKEKLIIS